jgi:hypothetical protein
VGKDGKPFQVSVPLFFIADAQTSAPLGLQRTVKENGQDKVINAFPFFFSKQDAQNILDQSRKQDPSLNGKTKIEVAMLPNIVSFLLSSNEPSASQFRLIPPRESLEFLQSQPPAAPGAAPGAVPALPPVRPPAAAPTAPAVRPPAAPTAPAGR